MEWGGASNASRWGILTPSLYIALASCVSRLTISQHGGLKRGSTRPLFVGKLIWEYYSE